jgi:hypothetical protein
VYLRRKAQRHDSSGQAAIDPTFFDCENASKHYCNRTNYRVQTLKTTALADTDSHVILCSSQHPAVSETVKSSYVWRPTTAKVSNYTAHSVRRCSDKV